MAGEYVEFVNNSQPALNEDNLNLMQQRIKQDIQGAVSGDTLPIGCILPFGSNTIPENWLLCNGQAVSRTTYSDLYNTIGITFGQGDGFTTFNLPDLRGRVVVGKNENDTDFDVIGDTGGEKTHTLTVNEMPRHKHLTVGNFGGTAGNKHLPQFVYKEADWNDGNVDDNAQYTGGSEAHNNLQPYQVQNYIIKAKQTAGVVAQVIDGLTSTSQTDALSANQGKILNDKVKPKYIIVTTNTSSNISSDFQVLLNSVSVNEGNKFSVSNNTIIVGTGVSKVRASAEIFVSNPQGTGYVWGKIVKNDYAQSTALTPYANAGGFLSVNIPSTIFNVSQGDVIKLIADSTCQGQIRTGVSDTWILIEVVE